MHFGYIKHFDIERDPPFGFIPTPSVAPFLIESPGEEKILHKQDLCFFQF